MAARETYTHANAFLHDIRHLPKSQKKAALRTATPAVRSSTCTGNRNVNTSKVNMLRLKLYALAILSYKVLLSNLRNRVSATLQSTPPVSVHAVCYLQVRMCNHPHQQRCTLLKQPAAY
jgi:hypothetical protein